jgi:acyl-coenzyme A thioesterase PaaI-like protein
VDHRLRRLQGWGCFTLNLNVDYHKFIPLGSTVRFECSLDRIEGKKAFIEAKLMHLVDDIVHSKAKVRALPSPESGIR